MSSNPFGESYLDPAVFLAQAGMFGCARAVQGMAADDLQPILAAASREVDVETGRTFLASHISENHAWDDATRRCKVNQPPVITLESFGIRVGAGLVSYFNVTPVEDDGAGKPVRFGTVYYNRQENYLEVTSLALAGYLVSPIVTLGLTEAQVEIVYTSLAAVPSEVALAVGFTAAAWLNDNAANNLILPGLAAMRDDDTEIRRAAVMPDTSQGLPPRAKGLLRNYRRIAIG